ncbi:MAG: hypothetical protein HQK77_02365 [Desulfobacterales bacterium]|nr:hypothetical protein [Desulfobacterales bacterium]
MAGISLYYFFFVFILGCQMVFSSGEPLFQHGQLQLSSKGISNGLIVCLRILNLICLSFVLIHTTRSAHIKFAIAWLIKFVPGIPEKKVAIMLTLFLRFLALLLIQGKLTRDACVARCIESRKHPVKKIHYMVLPYVRRMLLTADRLALAMVSRGYDEDVAFPKQVCGLKDWLALLMMIMLFLMIYFFCNNR